VKGSILAIAFGIWFILAPRSVIWFYGSLLGGRMERATPFGVRVAGGICLLLIVVLVTLIELKIIR
jgi:hypothetical protein